MGRAPRSSFYDSGTECDAPLAYINNPNGISDGLNYVEDCEDAEAYKRVFQMIFDALGQSQHYKMMTGQRTKS